MTCGTATRPLNAKIDWKMQEGAQQANRARRRRVHHEAGSSAAAWICSSVKCPASAATTTETAVGPPLPASSQKVSSTVNESPPGAP